MVGDISMLFRQNFKLIILTLPPHLKRTTNLINMNIRLILFVLFSLTLSFSCAQDKPKKKAKKKPKIERTKAKPATKAPASAETAPAMSAENLEKAEAIIAKIDMDVVEAMDGKTIYKKYCSVCHGFKGDMQMNGAKDLRKLKTSLVERVAQVNFGKGLMTPFEGVLKEEEIVAVAKYIETLRQ